MGVWGVGIIENDDARDVYQDYLELYDNGKRHSVIRRELEQRYQEWLNDNENQSNVLLAIAYAQWECGYSDAEMVSKVREIIASNVELIRWQGSRDLPKKVEVLNKFLQRLEAGNSKPRKRNRSLKPKAVFRPGDCLSVRLSDGEYGAVIVLAEDYGKSGGSNLVGLLDYKEKNKPLSDIFEKRQWLLLNHHNHDNSRYIHWCFPEDFPGNSIYECVSHTSIRTEDPQDSWSIGGWTFGMQLEEQVRWRKGER